MGINKRFILNHSHLSNSITLTVIRLGKPDVQINISPAESKMLQRGMNYLDGVVTYVDVDSISSYISWRNNA